MTEGNCSSSSGQVEFEVPLAEHKNEKFQRSSSRNVIHVSNRLEPSRSADNTDGNQYDFFYNGTGMALRPNKGQSFPISHGSKEAQDFEKASTAIADYLDARNFSWESINCMGRVNKLRQIESTIVIAARPRETVGKEAFLSKLEAGIRSETGLKLRIEFFEGRNELQSSFEFREPMSPLVSGISCGNVSQRFSFGTIGGFIGHQGKSSDEDVYAVSNHHVFAVDEVAVSFLEFAGNPKVSNMLETLKGLRNCNLEESADDLIQLWHISYGRKVQNGLSQTARTANVNALFSNLRKIAAQRNSLPEVDGLESNPVTGTRPSDLQDQLREETSSTLKVRVEDIAALYFFRLIVLEDLNQLRSHWKQAKINIEISLKILLTELTKDLSHAGWKRVLRDVETPAKSLKMMRTFKDVALQTPTPNERSTVLDALVLAVAPSLDSDNSLASLLNFIFDMHDPEICSKLEELLIEHPSRADQEYFLSRIREELEESRRPEMSYVTEEERSRDVQKLELQLKEAEDMASHPWKQVIGYVWASSGKVAEKKLRDDEYITQDWGLARLLPSFKAHVRSSFDQNVLRPDFCEVGHQCFLQHRIWNVESDWSRLRVIKRGRTTNYTVGRVNGVKAVVKVRDGEDVGRNVKEFNIICQSSNGLFSQEGDSGSWIMDKAGHWVGMMYGNLGDDTTVFTPSQQLWDWWTKALCPDTTAGDEKKDWLRICI